MANLPLLAFVTGENPELHRIVLQGVRSFNATRFPGHPDGEDVLIAIQAPDTQELLGGLLGRTSGGWLAIDLIFVPEACRGMGLGTRLIAMAEEEALRRGCHSSWLDTISPEALGLYRRLGYEIFGELRNYPAEFSRHFLQKKLS